MAEEFPDHSVGVITPDGELVSIDDTDRIISVVVKGAENPDDTVRILREFALACFERGHFEACCAYLEKAFPLVEKEGDQAKCLFAIGLTKERLGDDKAAMETYARAFDLPQEQNETWYVLNNNLAYFLNQEGRHEEAERHCRVYGPHSGVSRRDMGWLGGDAGRHEDVPDRASAKWRHSGRPDSHSRWKRYSAEGVAFRWQARL